MFQFAFKIDVKHCLDVGFKVFYTKKDERVSSIGDLHVQFDAFLIDKNFINREIHVVAYKL